MTTRIAHAGMTQRIQFYC